MNNIKQDRFMMRLLMAHWLIATFITSYIFNTYLIGFLIGGVITGISYITYKSYRGTRFFRIVISIALMSYSALFIQQFYGRIELHFHVFIALAFLTIYRDRIPLAVGSIFIALHHLSFNYLQQFGVEVMGTKIVVFNYGCGLDIVLLHGVMVLAEWFVLDLVVKGKIKEFEFIQRSKDKIVKQKSEFEAIFRHSKDGIAILDLESNFLDFNDAYLEMTGFSRDELLEKSGYELTAPEDKESVTNILGEVLTNGYVENFEKSCIVNQNKRIYTNMSITLLPDKKRLLLVAKDVTALKQYEKQSKMAAMGEMIGNIAHQWRQPLSVISTNATGLVMQQEYGMLDDEKLTKACEDINSHAQYLSQTIDDFRDFIKGDRVAVEFNLYETIGSFKNLVRGNIKAHNINFHLDIDTEIIMNGYPNELIQCFLNIFNNAKDALTNIESERYVFISAKIENEDIVIIIKDNAGGIPMDVLPNIFQPYFTTKHQSQGTGLGLSMTYNIIVDGMGGTIEAHNVTYKIEEQEYAGAEFVVKIPIKKD